MNRDRGRLIFYAVVLVAPATPALAHHEVVVAASIIPFIVATATLALGAIAGLRAYLRQKRRGEKASPE